MSVAYGSSTIKRRRRTSDELDAIDQAIITAVSEENPATLRSVYYRVMSAGAVDKTENDYRLVGRQLLKLRRTDVIPYSWITDGTRWITKPDSYGDVNEMLDDVAASYRRALWHDQDAEVHIFTEKDAISGVVLPETSRWDVPLGVLRGYSSESFTYSVAQSIRAARKAVYVYQLGDHDPSGVNAWKNFTEKVTEFLGTTSVYHDERGAEGRLTIRRDGALAPVFFERLAVTEQQIEEFQLPTRPTKATDSRAKNFEGESVEVDAIPPSALRDIVRSAIVQHIDLHALEMTRIAERDERAWLQNRLIGGMP